jgi:hypothetical protein
MKTILLISATCFLAAIIHGGYICPPIGERTQGDLIMYFILSAGGIFFLIIHDLEAKPEKRLEKQIIRLLNYLADL